MSLTLSQLKEGISSSFLPPSYYAQADCDELLDLRDLSGSFESEWIACHADIKAKWSDSDDPSGDISNEQIRYTSFITVSNATEQHEIASYVSDDFDLIHKSIVLGERSPIIEYLIEAYTSGKFPTPKEDGSY